MLTSQTKFISAVLFQLIIVAILIIYKLSTLVTGTEVFLKIMPVDPRDYLRGDYVTFQYDISRLDSALCQNPNALGYKDTVYVTLRKNTDYWTPIEITKDRPAKGNIFIKGKITDYLGKTIRIKYGIEEYFIPEETGQNFNFRDKKAGAAVMVDSKGDAVIRKIYIDGVPWP